MRKLVLVLLLACLAGLPAIAKASPKADAKSSASLDDRRKQLDELVKDFWEYNLRTSPEFATILGDKRYNDKLSDVSEKFIMQDLAETRKYLTKFQAIDTAGFPEQETLTQQLLVRRLKLGLDEAKFEDWLMPVTQFSGIHIDMPQFVSLIPFTSVKDYEDYITRLHGIPKLMDDTTDLMKKGMAKKLMPPKFLLEKVTSQAQKVVSGTPEDSPFAEPVKHFPKEISEADQKRLHDAVIAAITNDITPAYNKFIAFVSKDYAPHGRLQEGIWSLPNGDERYRARVADNTTTKMTPEEIHQLGLKEVARIEGEMTEIARKQGFSDLKAFQASLDTNPKLHMRGRKEILDLYRKYEDQMWAKLPQMFGRLPKAKVEVMPVEEFREKEASGASYNQGTPDGSRPGHIMVNTREPEKQKYLEYETTAYHEGVPGHHMQISIAQELPELPPVRQQMFFTAYVEGWALYSERLGREAGFFQDPYSLYGHELDDMLRAIRLVTDTGIHYKHWNRQQVVDYFHAHGGGMDENDIQSETDRYIAIPGQALGYKIGQLTILRLREKAQKELGTKFDIRGFHDEVLGAGALPMDVLETRINNWIAKQQGTSAAAK
jgi:uncharacterized protein (DUF885 family)